MFKTLRIKDGMSIDNIKSELNVGDYVTIYKKMGDDVSTRTVNFNCKIIDFLPEHIVYEDDEATGNIAVSRVWAITLIAKDIENLHIGDKVSLTTVFNDGIEASTEDVTFVNMTNRGIWYIHNDKVSFRSISSVYYLDKVKVVGFDRIDGVPHAFLGKGEVVISDTVWIGDAETVAAGVLFRTLKENETPTIGDEYIDEDYMKPFTSEYAQFGIKSTSVESLMVLRKAVDRAIASLQNVQGEQ